MPLYPLGISRRRDVPSVPKQAAGSVDVRWSLTGELACAFIDAPHQAVPPMLHATVLDAIHRRICVLPVRFGLALHDEAEIHSLLKSGTTNCSTISAALIGLARWGCRLHRHFDQACQAGKPGANCMTAGHRLQSAIPHPPWPIWNSAGRTINVQTKTWSKTARLCSNSWNGCTAAIGNGGSCRPPRRIESGWRSSSNGIA